LRKRAAANSARRVWASLGRRWLARGQAFFRRVATPVEIAHARLIRSHMPGVM
jgi:hypothetical protein